MGSGLLSVNPYELEHGDFGGQGRRLHISLTVTDVIGRVGSLRLPPRQTYACPPSRVISESCTYSSVGQTLKMAPVDTSWLRRRHHLLYGTIYSTAQSTLPNAEGSHSLPPINGRHQIFCLHNTCHGIESQVMWPFVASFFHVLCFQGTFMW